MSDLLKTLTALDAARTQGEWKWHPHDPGWLTLDGSTRRFTDEDLACVITLLNALPEILEMAELVRCLECGTRLPPTHCWDCVRRAQMPDAALRGEGD